jgi:hypothetical protein
VSDPTLTIDSPALVLRLGDDPALVLSLDTPELVLNIDATISVKGDKGDPGIGDRVVLTADTTLPIASGRTYVNSNTPIVATLPTSAQIGSTNFRVLFTLAYAQNLRVAAQGSDVVRWYGVEGAWLEIAERDAVLEVTYIGGGVFLVTNAEREWSFGP